MTQQLTVREQVRLIIEDAVDEGMLGIAGEEDIDDITNKILDIPAIAKATQ